MPGCLDARAHSDLREDRETADQAEHFRNGRGMKGEGRRKTWTTLSWNTCMV